MGLRCKKLTGTLVGTLVGKCSCHSMTYFTFDLAEVALRFKILSRLVLLNIIFST